MLIFLPILIKYFTVRSFAKCECVFVCIQSKKRVLAAPIQFSNIHAIVRILCYVEFWVKAFGFSVNFILNINMKQFLQTIFRKATISMKKCSFISLSFPYFQWSGRWCKTQVSVPMYLYEWVWRLYTPGFCLCKTETKPKPNETIEMSPY